MDAVAIRERTQAAPNGYVQELHPDADPHMTRAAREARTAWRLEHLAEWHRGLETLFYFDPEYAYDVVHEYEDEWTTDPDHSGDGIKFYEFNEGGVLEPTDDRRTLLEGVLLILLRTVLGNRAESQGRLYFAGDLAERLQLLTRGGNPGSYVKPDLMVFPLAYELPAGVHRDRSDCALRPHEGEPPPELVVEVLSVSSVARDYGVKARLYAALGVPEYWVCDVGGMRRPGSPVELSVFRLGADGRYAPVPPSPPPTGAGDRWEVPVYGGGVLGRPFRLRPGAYEPRFQWWDGAQGRWRDPESDAAHERQVERERHIRERQADQERHAHERQADRERHAHERQADRERHAHERQADRERHARELEVERDRHIRELQVVRAEERMEMAMASLHALLSDHLHSRDRDRIAAHWRQAGPPPDVMDRLLQVRQAPAEWRSLLRIPDVNGNTDSR